MPTIEQFQMLYRVQSQKADGIYLFQCDRISYPSFYTLQPMKQLLLALFLCSLACGFVTAVFAQDRTLSQRRVFQPLPQLSALPNTDVAVGIAQTPQGYAMPIQGDPIPAGSTAGIFGHSLVSSGAASVLLWSASGEVVLLPAETWRTSFPGLEMATFRLPTGWHGDVWITLAGRQASNTVKITIE